MLLSVVAVPFRVSGGRLGDRRLVAGGPLRNLARTLARRNEALAVGVKPDELSTEGHRLSKQLGVGGQRHVGTRVLEFLRQSRREARRGEQGVRVRKKILWRKRMAESSAKNVQQPLREVWLRACGIAPKGHGVLRAPRAEVVHVGKQMSHDSTRPSP